jgi:hypothetical protein
MLLSALLLLYTSCVCYFIQVSFSVLVCMQLALLLLSSTVMNAVLLFLLLLVFVVIVLCNCYDRLHQNCVLERFPKSHGETPPL